MENMQNNSSTRDKGRILLDPVVPSLFAEKAQEAACVCSRGNKNKSSQLRKFYDELVMWYDKVYFAQTPEAKEAKFKEVEPFIQMMRAKAAYAKGRDLIDDDFFNLFDGLVCQIKTPDTLRTAKFFFEAFLGYKKFFESTK